MFMEFLAKKWLITNIANHMAGIRSQFMIHSLETTLFQHEEIQLFHKALKIINRPLTPYPNTVITIQMLENIIHITQSLEFPVAFNGLYLLAFYLFMHITNVLPQNFDLL